MERSRCFTCGCALVLFLVTVIGLVGIVYVFSEDSLTPPERARVILSNAPLIDGKNDFAYNIRRLAYNDLRKFNFSTNMSLNKPWRSQRMCQTDLLRLKEGNVGAQVWVAKADCGSQFKDAVSITLEQIDVIKRLVSNYSSVLTLVNTSADILQAKDDEKIASIISIEGGHSIHSSLGILRMYYDLGVRMMTLVKSCTTPWIDSSTVDHSNKDLRTLRHNQGIYKFGEDVVAEMNRLGMIIDLSHSSIDAMKEVLDKSKAPVVFSHSAARNICDSDSNLQDDILELVRKKDSLVMITFDSESITCGSSNYTMHHVIEHIEYIKSKTSVDNIGIGSNFDGMDRPVKGLEDVSKFPNLFAALVEAGWDYDDLEKLAGKNFMRVFTQVEEVRDSLNTMDPIQTYINRQRVRNISGTERCTSELGLFPPADPLSTSNFSFQKHIFNAMG